MGKTSSTVKDAWNSKAYDSFLLRVPNGRLDDIRKTAEENGETVNGMINRLLMAEVGMAEEEWKERTPKVNKREGKA